MSKSERGQGIKDAHTQIVPDECRKPLGFGIRGEDLFSQVRPTERHLSGARAFQAAQREYNGGASLAERADRR